MTIRGTDKTYHISQNDCYYAMLTRIGSKLSPDDIQNNRGVYIFWDWDNKPIRIGKAKKIRNRLISYANSPSNYSIFDKMQDSGIQYVSAIYTENETESCAIELDLLTRHKPEYNTVNIR